MSHNSIRFTIFAALFTLWPVPVFAVQEPAVRTSASESASDARTAIETSALEQRGLDLIRDAAKDAVALTDRRSSVRLQARAADLLWKHDAEQARGYFERAYSAAADYYRETRDDNMERVGRNSFVGRSDLRLDVIRLASRCDAELGRRLTDMFVAEKKREAEDKAVQSQQSQQPDRGSNRLFGRPEQASGDLLSAAQSLLDSDQKLALELASRSLAEGVSQRTPQFLVRLAEKDRAAANAFYLASLERSARENPPLPGQLLLLSAYPFGENRIYVSDGSNTSSYAFQPIKDFIPDAAIIGRFLQTAGAVLARTAQLTAAQSPDITAQLNVGLFAARLLAPKVAEHQPALQDEWAGLVAQLVAAAQESARQGIERTLEEMAQDRQRQAAQQGQAAPNTDRLKSLLERANNASDPGERDGLYQQAAFEAAQQGEFAQALSIAEKISDYDFKRGVLGWLHFNAATKAVEESRFDDARRHAIEVPALDQRAYLFFQIAGAVWKQKDRVRAIELLEEAVRQAESADASNEKLRAQLGIAHLYAGIDSVRSFEILGDAMKTAVKVSDYSTDQARLLRTLQSRGMNMTSVSTVDGFDIGKTLGVFAKLDFERALGLAQSMENRALRCETVMAIAATLFEKTQQTK
ncbi:MAG: hypothetical protein KIT57_18430 [Blastocatellales bacterium]|nr:hypothetical protein [Blastocatellales bacterium]